MSDKFRIGSLLTVILLVTVVILVVVYRFAAIEH